MYKLILLSGILCLSTPMQGTLPETDKRKLSPFFTLDTYQSFIGNKGADVWGFKAGIVWNSQWRLGVGYNKISSDIIERKALPDQEINFSNDDTVKAQLFFHYYPIVGEYILYSNDPWQFSATAQMGYGKSYFEYFGSRNESRKIFKRGIIAFQPGLSAQYKVLKWFGIGAGLGYRFMLLNNPEIDTKLHSPVMAIGLKIYIGEIIRSLSSDPDRK